MIFDNSNWIFFAITLNSDGSNTQNQPKYEFKAQFL